jgi:hypothetical protein
MVTGSGSYSVTDLTPAKQTFLAVENISEFVGTMLVDIRVTNLSSKTLQPDDQYIRGSHLLHRYAHH